MYNPLFDLVAEEMDVIAAKFGNSLLLSPTGLLIVCGSIIAIAGLLVWYRKTE